MISKERVLTILRLAFPVTIALGSSMIMVMIDLAMVGTLGNNAVAGIGLAGFVSTLVFAFVLGISPAVQGIVARRLGADSQEKQCLPVNAGLLLALCLGLPLSLLGSHFSPWVFNLLSDDPGVVQEGSGYLSILLLACVAQGMNNAFEGHWNGLSRMKMYMSVILFTNVLNIFCNYVFIFGNFGAPALGSRGAAMASVIAICSGMLIYLAATWQRFRHQGFLSAMPGTALVRQIFKIGLPSTLQQVFFSLGSVVLFWMYGQIGTSELAAAAVLVRTTMVMFLFAMALGKVSATLVSEALGRGDSVAATRFGEDAGKIGVIWITALGLPLLFFPTQFLGLFLSDAETIALATLPLQITAVSTGVVSLSFIFTTTLFSVGYGKKVMLISFSLRWLLFIPAVWVLSIYLGYGLLEVWFAQMIYGLVLMLMITGLWRAGKWKNIRV